MGRGHYMGDRSWLVLAACGLVVVGCSPPHMASTVAVEAPSGTFSGDRCVVRIEPLTFPSDMTVGGSAESAYLTTLSPKQLESYAIDKADSSEAFTKSVEMNASSYVESKGGTVTIGRNGNQPYVTHAVVSAWDPKGAMHVTFTVVGARDGREIAKFSADFGMPGYGSGQKMRANANQAGWTVLSFFRDRFECSAKA